MLFFIKHILFRPPNVFFANVPIVLWERRPVTGDLARFFCINQGSLTIKLFSMVAQSARFTQLHEYGRVSLANPIDLINRLGDQPSMGFGRIILSLTVVFGRQVFLS